VPTFEVTQSRGWYEAECRELGITITARRLDEIEATARRSVARAAKGANTVVELVMTRKQDSLLSRLAGFFSRSSREGNS
jgi:hypothetical protein